MNPLILSRRRYLQLLDSALSADRFRFARLSALNWLAAYPGDLAVGLAYARALAGEGRLEAATPILQGLCRADPEYLEVVDLLAQVEQVSGDAASSDVGSHLFALTGHSLDHRTLSPWGGSLWLARQAMRDGKTGLADEMLRDALRLASGEVLVQVVHLAWLRRSPGFDPHAGREIALGYHRRSPDCLAVMLHLADWSLQVGDEEYAVALLHQAAARDVGAQAAVRVWGEHNPYRSLWPERLELALNLSIPAEVSALLGWNRLSAGGALGDASDASAAQEARAPISLTTGDGDDERTAHDVVNDGVRLEESKQTVFSKPDGIDPVLEPVGLDSLPSDSFEDTRPTRVGKMSEPVSMPVHNTDGIDWALLSEEDAFSELSAGIAQETSISHGVPAAGVSLVEEDFSLNQAEPADVHSRTRPAKSPAGVARARLEALFGAQRAAERPAPRPPAERKPLDPDLRQVSKDLDAAARRMKLPGLGHRDGRFPVYVIFSLRGRLEADYGAGVAALLESEMDALAQAVGRRRGWTARLVLADDPASLETLGLEPVCSGDPWELKLLLADLDAALARRGECIGALLIVGGPEIVPFHHLPNPVDDQDCDVATDNPYATRDENYFLPEWPVGRLPGGAGMDARLLLDSLRRISRRHASAEARQGWLGKLFARLRALFGRVSPAGLSPFGAAISSPALWEIEDTRPATHSLFSPRPSAFGYTAAVWKPAATRVFAALGRSGRMYVSPPLGFDGSHKATARDAGLPRVSGLFGYFNLHGVVDSPEWFGQRDPLDPSGAPDFPVALRPQDVLCSRQADSRRAIPALVFTQACYGLHIAGRQPEHSMALSFLSAGSLAVVGCTCMSYGAITPPLSAGDLLAQTFWRLIRQGQPAGEALRQAKIHLASEMVARQGFLDGEDQKTLISFVLYGDPLTTARPSLPLPKTIRYQDGLPLEAPTVCDRAEPSEAGEPLPPEVLAAVRRVVARSLPGMADARLIYTRPRAACEGQGHACPTSQLEQRHSGPEVDPCRPTPATKPVTKPAKGRSHRKSASFGSCSLITLSKPVTMAGGAHPRVARLTLNENGELVKLVVSR